MDGQEDSYSSSSDLKKHCPFWQRATPEERADAFRKWANEPRPQRPRFRTKHYAARPCTDDGGMHVNHRAHIASPQAFLGDVLGQDNALMFPDHSFASSGRPYGSENCQTSHVSPIVAERHCTRRMRKKAELAYRRGFVSSNNRVGISILRGGWPICPSTSRRNVLFAPAGLLSPSYVCKQLHRV